MKRRHFLLSLAAVAASLIRASFANTIVLTGPITPATGGGSPVTFDVASHAQEFAGDGVLALTHTASGSNRGVFVGTGNVDGVSGQPNTSVSYGGTGMTELWDAVVNGSRQHAGFSLAIANGVLTGSQTITNTLAGATLEHAMGVISMAGVNQATPVGTPATGSGVTSPATVTVTGVGANDMVVDNLFVESTPTVGANQTERWAEDGGFFGFFYRGSTQAGSDGGVMSWTFTDDDWGLGAVAFKPA